MISINQLTCDNCGSCVSVCPEDALVLDEKKLNYFCDICTNCKKCIPTCPVGALRDE